RCFKHRLMEIGAGSLYIVPGGAGTRYYVTELPLGSGFVTISTSTVLIVHRSARIADRVTLFGPRRRPGPPIDAPFSDADRPPKPRRKAQPPPGGARQCATAVAPGRSARKNAERPALSARGKAKALRPKFCGERPGRVRPRTRRMPGICTGRAGTTSRRTG